MQQIYIENVAKELKIKVSPWMEYGFSHGFSGLNGYHSTFTWPGGDVHAIASKDHLVLKVYCPYDHTTVLRDIRISYSNPKFKEKLSEGMKECIRVTSHVQALEDRMSDVRRYYRTFIEDPKSLKEVVEKFYNDTKEYTL